MNKSKKFIVGIVLLILGIVGAVAAFAQGVVSTGFACLLFLAAGIVLIILDKKLPTKENSAAIQSNTSQNTLTTKGTHSQKFKIAGVTYDNRQEHLAKLMQQKLSGKVIKVELQEYEYENQPAIKVIANGLDIGSLHSEDILRKTYFNYRKQKIKKSALLDWNSNRAESPTQGADDTITRKIIVSHSPEFFKF